MVLITKLNGVKKLNMDSWSPGANLYQAKLFPLDGYYSKVGYEAQHHLQHKTSSISHSKGVDFNSSPTGYGKPLKENNHMDPLKETLPHIPQIKWNCPPKFSVDYKWHVAAGEESEEIVTQKHRETRVVEAIYPHLSAIPPSPSVSLDVENCHQDDSTIPVIPLTAIEEAAEPFSNIEAARNTSVRSQAPDLPRGSSTPENINTPQSLNLPSVPQKPALGILPSFNGDVAAAAASAALTALVKSQEKGSLIDTDLLIKILSNPKLIEKLTDERRATDNTGGDPLLVLKPVTESLPLAGLIPELVTKKSMNDHSAPANTGTAPISGPKKTVTALAPFPSSNPEVIKNFTNENGPPGHMSPTPISWSSPVTIASSKPVDMMIKNWINEHCSAQTAGSKPVTQSVPLPNAKPDMVTIKRMINEYGAPDNMGNKPLPMAASLFPSGKNIRSPSPATTQTSPFSAPIAPPVKDMNYIKNLIKEHGDRREKQDSNLSLSGKLYNDLQGPEPVKNLKSSKSKPKNEKPCIYFNSSRGCREGSTCLYKHDTSSGPYWGRPGKPGRVLGATRAKRLRL